MSKKCKTTLSGSSSSRTIIADAESRGWGRRQLAETLRAEPEEEELKKDEETEGRVCGGQKEPSIPPTPPKPSAAALHCDPSILLLVEDEQELPATSLAVT